MKIKLLLLLVAISLSFTSLNAATTRWGADWWRDHDLDYKLGFIGGYMAARQSDVTAITRYAASRGHKAPTPPMCAKCTVDQFIDGINIFYQDPANALIDIRSAFDWLSLKFSGESDKHLQIFLEDFRKDSARD